MEFWTLWFIGIAITIVTRIAINILSHNDDIFNNKAVKIIMSILVIICISIVGGIIVGKWIGVLVSTWIISEFVFSIFFASFTTIAAALLTYLVGFYILGLYHFDENYLRILFVVVFIVSIIGWSIPICNYNRNIEETKQTVVVSQEERQLLYFCSIPVQNVSGEVSGSFGFGGGHVSGKITTLDTLPYWYSNQNDEAIFDSVSATDSKIIFIDDNEAPYIEIIVYSEQTVSKNHNNGTEKVTVVKEWAEYTFYLPDSIMQYNSN